MPETFRLSQTEYTALSQHLSALADSLRLLQGVSQWLAPGMQVSALDAYREMWHKTDTALRVHAEESQIALAMWDLSLRRHALTQKENDPHAHP
jgi:hypothetical protein